MRLPVQERLKEHSPIHLEIWFDLIFPEPFIRYEKGIKVLFVTEQMTDDIYNTFDNFDITKGLSDEEKKLVYNLVGDFKMFGSGLREDQLRIN